MTITEKTSSIALIALLLFGCAAKQSSGFLDSSQKLSGNGFTLLPPAENGWKITERTLDKIVLLQTSPVKLNTTEAVAVITKSPFPIGTEEEFLDQLRRHRRDEIDKRQSRVMLYDEVLSHRKDDRFCTRYKYKLRDFSVRMHSPLPYLQVATYGLSCLHPLDHSMILDVSFTHRSKPNTQVHRLAERADGFLDNVRMVVFE